MCVCVCVCVCVCAHMFLERETEREKEYCVSLPTASEFSPSQGTVTFPLGVTRENILLTLPDDTMCDDEEETFSLILESRDPSVRLGPLSTTEVSIEDNDGMLESKCGSM